MKQLVTLIRFVFINKTAPYTKINNYKTQIDNRHTIKTREHRTNDVSSNTISDTRL